MMLESGDGPRLLNDAMRSLMSVAPAENASGLLAGDVDVMQPGPLLPLEKAGKMPAVRQFCRTN